MQLFIRSVSNSARESSAGLGALLPDTTLNEAEVVVERLRRRLENSPMEKDGEQVRLTATFAITEVAPGDRNIEEIIRRTDDALYEGKRAGRNRVMVAATDQRLAS